MPQRGKIWSKIDWLTAVIYLILLIIGWLNVYAAVYTESHHPLFDISTRYTRQFLFILLALFLAFSAILIEVNFYTFFAYVIYALGILALAGVLVAGKEINNARSWYSFGWFNIQPSEFAKLAVCFGLAKFYSTFNLKTDTLRTTLIAGALIILPMLLILMQPDTGSAIVFLAFLIPMYREGMPPFILIIGILAGILFFLALILDKLTIILLLAVLSAAGYYLWQKKWKEVIVGLFIPAVFWFFVHLIDRIGHLGLSSFLQWTISLVTGLFVIAFLAIRYRLKKVFVILGILVASISFTFSVEYVFDHFLNSYQKQRVRIMLNLEQDPQGVGYNQNQSKIAIGSGGFFGKGFLKGTQNKGEFVPEQSTDFIFCTIGEEWGFLGSLVVLGLYALLIFRLFQMAEKQRSRFSRFFGYSVASVFLLHVIVNIGMAIGLLPVIGIPLPFVSYGGSSLWAFTLMLFIFLRLDASRLEMLR
ncbi:MAG: rod shape-determining protein RodA [Bacteroidales bacterium]|nr:rod shape-determining protein RodA [Bacteroidales bacterium]